jgi:integrase
MALSGRPPSGGAGSANEGKVALNVPIIPRADRLTLSEAADLIRRDYVSNGHKSGRTLEVRLANLLDHFDGASRIARITTGHVEAYKAARLEAKAAPASVNRELAILGRMGTLARHQYGLVVPFRCAKLEERNVRTGFFEEEQFKAVVQHLRPELAALVTAAKLTGWRKSELQSRQWRHCDFTAGWLRLEPEETKNRDGRQFPFDPGAPRRPRGAARSGRGDAEGDGARDSLALRSRRRQGREGLPEGVAHREAPRGRAGKAFS